MTIRSFSFCLFFALVAVAVAVVPNLASGAPTGPIPGGWTPIKNLSDPHVKEIAKFAVAEYNKQSHAGLILQKVVSGKTQVVSGMNYKLVLETKVGPSATAAAAGTNLYEAVVWEKVWENFRKLTSFKPVKA